MNPRKLKRMAAEIMQVGESKIWVDPDQMTKAAEAMTRDDVRNLISQRIVRKRKDQHHSRGGARILHAKKRLGRKTGKGKRTGTKKARSKPRKQWITRVRALRKTLRQLRKEGKVTQTYRTLYRQVKGNHFRGKKHLEQTVQGEAK
ncbi:MAG: 50S ribosomal protein L19e [Candidatus Diapherotrites archaeon]